MCVCVCACVHAHVCTHLKVLYTEEIMQEHMLLASLVVTSVSIY